MTAAEWITSFAQQLGVDPPDEATMETLLAVASRAAHSSERLAAPIACYLIGRAGISPGDALPIAEAVGAD